MLRSLVEHERIVDNVAKDIAIYSEAARLCLDRQAFLSIVELLGQLTLTSPSSAPATLLVGKG